MIKCFRGEKMFITKEKITEFEKWLEKREKTCATAEKYAREVLLFARWLSGREATERSAAEYKRFLTCRRAPSTVNGAVSALNAFFGFSGKGEMRVKSLKFVRNSSADKEREMTAEEYRRLLSAAKKKSERLYLLMQTVCSCGLRVSELRFVTVEAALSKRALIALKGKIREVLLPGKLCKMLLKYAKRSNIKSGAVFITRTGRPLDRFYIWRSMKALCKEAGVSEKKVFPHNLRHLFARTFYGIEKDIAKLADILGHSSINTTRIYIISTGTEHRQRMENMRLII